jgi:hypothetical protein
LEERDFGPYHRRRYDAMMYKAAVQYMYSWFESRLINATKANKSASKSIHVIALDSDGEEVSTDEDDTMTRSV